MFEFQIPFVCLIFNILIIAIYFSKKRINIKENTYYKNILFFTLSVNTTNLISHYLADVYRDNLPIWFNSFFSNINKLGSIFIVIISYNLLAYILYISFGKYREKYFFFKSFRYFIYVTMGIIIFLLDFKVYNANGITTGAGSSVSFTFLVVFINLFLSFFISLLNIKKKDKRYYAVYFIIPIMVILSLFVLLHPEFNIYDLILSLLCYLMYFTIENPDVKLLLIMEETKNMAEKANRAKSEFLSSMSHEIRTPLNAIVGLSEDIGTFKNEVPSQVREDAEDIISASETLLEIVGNILDISKIESDKMELVEVKYNFKEEMDTITKINSSRIGDKNIILNYQIAEDIPYELLGDKIRIKQIVNNLLSNAIKYTDEGEINFNIKCINEGNVSNIIMTCQDTGKGIKKENIDRLFSKFDRLDVEKNTTVEGTGLGLAITKRLVEMMNGKINVESIYGKGSIFVVIIPQKISSISKPLTIESFNNKDNSINTNIVSNNNFINKRILIADDNKLNIKVARRLLSEFHGQIDECYDGIECVEMVKKNKYDLILMDIMMPNMSGTEALRELKKDVHFNIPVIALTADAINGAKEKYLQDGFTDYISKPFNKEQILEKITSCLM